MQLYDKVMHKQYGVGSVSAMQDGGVTVVFKTEEKSFSASEAKAQLKPVLEDSFVVENACDEVKKHASVGIVPSVGALCQMLLEE